MVTTLKIVIFVLFYGGLSSVAMHSVWGMCDPVGQIRTDLRFSPNVKELVVSIVQEERSKRIEEYMFHPPIDVFLSVNESALAEHKKELVQAASTQGDWTLIQMLSAEDRQTRKNFETLLEQNDSGPVLLMPNE
jgi:hypothetical protein